jgi:hypothetical protein
MYCIQFLTDDMFRMQEAPTTTSTLYVGLFIALWQARV